MGLYDPATGAFYLKNTNDYGAADLTFFFGPAGMQPVMGDWDNTGQLRRAVKRAGERGNGEGVDARPAGGGEESAAGGNGTGARRRRAAGRATEGTMSWNQEFDYDRHGNRTWNGATRSNVQGPAITIDAATNRINTAGYQYDHAGNMTIEPGKTHQYDAMNKIWKTTVDSGGTTTTATMVYDALGRRVKKIVQVGQAAATTTRFVYGMGGALIAEHTTTAAPGSPSKEYVYGPTEMAATVDNPSTAGRVVTYLTPDHLGSPRIVTGGTSGAATMVSRHDYLPFGEELFAAPNGQPGIGGRTTGQGYAAATQTDGVRQQFTSMERDTETSLDYFGARYCSYSHGRFMSTDLLFADQQPALPQSWNLYSYTRNNPITAVDIGGRSTHTTSDGLVLAVNDDGDLGVYSHENIDVWWEGGTLGTEREGIVRRGETKYWDEFRGHDNRTGAIEDRVAKNARIIFDTSFDATISDINTGVQTESLLGVAEKSKNGQVYDIKANRTVAPHGPNTGRLLNGKYATARSAGNYLAGYNGATATITNEYLSETDYMRLAGAFHQGHGGKWDTVKLLAGGEA